MLNSKKIKTKPVIKEAICLVTLQMSTIKDVLEFMGQSVGSDDMSQNKFYDFCSMVSDSGGLFIQTLEGDMKADVGDWVIKGVNGEFYPIKPDAFFKTYDIL